ncbi:MAG: hypothetical protein Q8R70_09330, partial [Methanoregula sp.]|nr:hypothetical protein [Methanoregula sp.]
DGLGMAMSLLGGGLIATSSLGGISALLGGGGLTGILGSLAGGAGGIAGGLGGAAATGTTVTAGTGLAAAIEAQAAAAAAEVAAVQGGGLAAAIEAQAAFEAPAVATAASMSGAALAASIGAGLLAGLVGVRVMTETGLLKDLAGLGNKIKNDHPVMMNAAKIFFAPFGAIGSVAIDAANLHFDKIPQHLAEIVEQTRQAAEDLIRAFTDVIFGGFGNIIAGAIEFGSEFISSIVGGISDTIKDLTGSIDSIKTTISSKLTDLVNGASKWGSSLITGFAKGISATISVLTGWLSSITSTVSSAFSTIITNAFSWGKGIISAFVGGVWSMWTFLTGATGSVVDSVTGSLKGLIGEAVKWGRGLIVGFGAGIAEMAYGTGSWFWQQVNNVAGIIKSILGIHSNAKEGPLSDMMSWGPNLTKSLASGMLSEIDKVQAAADSIAAAASVSTSQITEASIAATLDIPSIPDLYAKINGILNVAAPDMSYAVGAMPALSTSAPGSVNNSRQFQVSINLDNITIRDERDIDLLTNQIATKINRKWAT